MSQDPLDLHQSDSPATADLARRVPEHPAQALQDLYVRIAPALHAWAAIHIPKSLVGRLDPAEVTQEVWLRALEKSSSFDPSTTPFRPWIFSIAGYVLMESFRRAARVDSGHDGQGESGFSMRELPAEITTVSRQAARDEQIQLLISEAQYLSQDERRLLLFRGLEGLSYDVIAERLGIEATTAMKRWQRLREGLANRLRLRDVLVES